MSEQTMLEKIQAHVSGMAFPEGITVEVVSKPCEVCGEHILLEVKNAEKTVELGLASPPYEEGEFEEIAEVLTVETVMEAFNNPPEDGVPTVTITVIIGNTDALFETMPDALREEMLADPNLPSELREFLTRKS